MSETITHEIRGIFVNLHREPLRVVFRRQVDFRNERYDVFKVWDKIEAVYEVLQTLSEEKRDFVQRIMSVDEKYYRDNPHRTRRYVHTDRTQLYPERPDLEELSHKVGELWVGTNLNTGGMLQVIKEACEAAEIEYGRLAAIRW